VPLKEETYTNIYYNVSSCIKSRLQTFNRSQIITKPIELIYQTLLRIAICPFVPIIYTPLE
jgi:hypothetical protein